MGIAFEVLGGCLRVAGLKVEEGEGGTLGKEGRKGMKRVIV